MGKNGSGEKGINRGSSSRSRRSSRRRESGGGGAGVCGQ
jgi:hypothetical protein